MNPLFASKRIRFKSALALLLVLLLVVRCGCHSCHSTDDSTPIISACVDTILRHSQRVDHLLSQPRKPVALTNADGTPLKHRIIGVGDYNACFPDMNDVQLATAKRLGIDIIADRDAAQARQQELVYINDNALYRVQHLSHSIPYLVPRAQRLLNEISLNFIDSLQCKGLPFYKIIVTSVLRTEHDVNRLRRVNGNATANSCHQYGTTFDICYNSFYRVIDPDDPSARQVWDGRLKDVLAEVLRDMRLRGLCYVRYEAHQACFHITAR